MCLNIREDPKNILHCKKVPSHQHLPVYCMEQDLENPGFVYHIQLRLLRYLRHLLLHLLCLPE